MENSIFFSNRTNSGNEFNPIFLKLSRNDDAQRFKELMTEPTVRVFDTIKDQIAELIKIKNPGKRFTPAELEGMAREFLGSAPSDEYGLWVYYPWSQRLVHLVEEEDFITLRTSRNAYKISPIEQKGLRTKKIGIIGLSVGQAIAITMATERICGELRLADFDKIELSNLNRLAVGVHELGMPKVVVAARRIAEIDPFIKVKCWTEGINENNIDEFLIGDDKLDVLVEECDTLELKIFSRVKARAAGIPVVMDTNDKGMLDVERFDIKKDQPILHGRIAELEGMESDVLWAKLKTLSVEERFGLLTKIIGFENISEEMKLSLSEMNKTIVGWPQIASAVNLGGAMVTDVCRRIILGKNIASGRYFVDLNKLIP